MMLRMRLLFLGMVIWNIIFFAATIFMGMAHYSNHWQHQALGVVTGIFTCLTHCVVMMHFMGSGKGIKEAIANYDIPNDPETGYTRRLRKMTARSSSMATFGCISIIIVVWLGGAKDVGRLHGLTHGISSWFVIAFNIYAFWV